MFVCQELALIGGHQRCWPVRCWIPLGLSAESPAFAPLSLNSIRCSCSCQRMPPPACIPSKKSPTADQSSGCRCTIDRLSMSCDPPSNLSLNSQLLNPLFPYLCLIVQKRIPSFFSLAQSRLTWALMTNMNGLVRSLRYGFLLSTHPVCFCRS